MRDAPELRLGLHFYFFAFHELSSSRPVGWGMMPIPWSTIAEYAVLFGLEADEFEDLVHHVRALDRVYLEYHASQTKKERKR